jgi:hypothetical protein
MNDASLAAIPSTPVFFVLSEPAKSTKWSFEHTSFPLDSTLDFISRWIVKIQCDLEEVLFN